MPYALGSLLHVLIIPSAYPDSALDISGTFFREQAVALAKAGVTVGVIYPSLRSLRMFRTVFGAKYGLELVNDQGVITLRYHGFAWIPGLNRLSHWYWLRRGRQLAKHYFIRFGQPDVMHVHCLLRAGSLAKEILNSYGIPYVVTEHSSAYKLGLLSPFSLHEARTIARFASHRIAVSRSLRGVLLDVLGDEQTGDWEVVPNIVSGNFLLPSLPSKRQTGVFCFLTLARLTENKGIANLIHAFSEGFRNQADAKLLIAGDGPERHRLEELSITLGVSDKIEFLGHITRDHVVTIMEMADVFVLPSSYETFGVVLIEALALGKPVISTRCGGPEDIVECGNGLLVDVDSVYDLKIAMTRVNETIGDYEQSEIREKCIARFGEAFVVEQLKKLYVTASKKHIN